MHDAGGKAVFQQCTSVFCCISVILLLILATTIRTPPRIDLHSIYIPSLDKGANSSTDTTLIFKINFKSTNPFTRLNYDPTNITFYDGPKQAIANFTIPHFYQDRDSVKKGGTINITGFGREAAMQDISANGYWVLRVDLVTSLRYKFMWKSRTKHYRVGANVHIGDTGIKVNHKKGARLTSGAIKIGSSVFERVVFILINLFVACFLCSY